VICQGRPLKYYPLDLIERHVVRSAIIELRRARAGMVRHQRRIFERSAELPKHRNPGCTERVIADGRGDPRRSGALAHQLEGVDPVQGVACQLPSRPTVRNSGPLASAAMPVPSTWPVTSQSNR
jgi:hypothetical protein